MPRILYTENALTGERSQERDVTGLPEDEVFVIKFQMLAKTDLSCFLVDSAEEDGSRTERSANG